MPSDGKKEPLEDLKEKLRSLLGFQERRKNTLPPKAHFSIWYFLIAFLLFSYLQQYYLSRKVETIPYSQFKQYVVAGDVGKLTIGPENINGTLKGNPGQAFTTLRVNDPGLVKDLDDHKVGYSGHYESKFMSSILSWVIPIGFFS